jgi:hypothetical protein
MHKIGIGIGIGLFVFAFSSMASAQEPEPPPPAPAPPPPPPPPGRSPMTQEAPTVAPASDPAHASPSTVSGPSLTEPPRAVPQQYPAVGGHFGTAIPIVTVSGDTTVIGADFVTLGLTPGMTVHLDDKWAIDFEFIAFNQLKSPAVHGNTTLVVDPGIIRKFDGFNLGLRVATQVGAPINSALVPIFVLPIKVSKRSVYFVEADLPTFVRDNGHKAELSTTFQIQTGFGF